MKEMTRRDFLKLSAVFLGGAALGACAPLVVAPVPDLTPVPPTPQLKPTKVEQAPIIEVVRDTHVSVNVGDKSFGYYGSFPDLYKDRLGNQGFSIGSSDNVLNLWGADRLESYRVTGEKIEGPIRNIKFMFSNPTVCGLNVEKGSYKFVNPASLNETYTLRTDDKSVFIGGVLTVFDLDRDGKISTRKYLTESKILSDTKFQTNAVQIDGAWQIMDDGQAEKVSDNGRLVTVLATGKSTGPVAYLYEGYNPEINYATPNK